jgi:hypothetical protein
MSLLRRAWLGLRFRDALLLTIVPLAALALGLGGAVRDYLDARQFDDWWSRGQSVGQFFTARAGGLATLPTSLRLRDQFNPEAADAGIIRIELPAAAWDSIEGNGQTMWGEWVDGTLRYGETQIAVRLRKRGDNSIHWLTDKRTITVRTPRDDFYKRFRSFGLSVKDVLPAYLANRLAQEFGILAPATEVVPVYINNRFVGMYRFVEVVDESFLRPFDRMPGNIFRGDAAERSEYRKGVPRNLYENPYLWDRAAANDRVTSAGTGQLRLLIVDLTGTTFADHQRMIARLDRNEFARLFAYLFIAGDPYHMDGVHNQLLYEDPSTQQLHPIPWDTRLLDFSRPRQRFNHLFQAVLRDPFVVDATMREIARQIEDDHILRVADSLATAADTRYAPYCDAGWEMIPSPSPSPRRRGSGSSISRPGDLSGLICGALTSTRFRVARCSCGWTGTATASSIPRIPSCGSPLRRPPGGLGSPWRNRCRSIPRGTPPARRCGRRRRAIGCSSPVCPPLPSSLPSSPTASPPRPRRWSSGPPVRRSAPVPAVTPGSFPCRRTHSIGSPGRCT